ncbi:MAG TPA: serine protein kinase, partial [Acidobacteriota bacterium]|nr:serine protein kinase [Acidobacteriota bacterium]
MGDVLTGDGHRILQSLNELVDSERFRKLHWEGSIDEYLSMVLKNPRIARTAFQRVYDMIMSYGYEEFYDGKEKLVRYNFFTNPQFSRSDAIYGLERSLMNLVQVFRSASQRYGPERRVLLLHGPVGSSKSTIVRLVKRGLEEYSRTDEGGLYSFGWAQQEVEHGKVSRDVRWCPMNEEPLHLIPLELRDKFLRTANEGRPPDSQITIEGDLCP